LELHTLTLVARSYALLFDYNAGVGNDVLIAEGGGGQGVTLNCGCGESRSPVYYK